MNKFSKSVLVLFSILFLCFVSSAQTENSNSKKKPVKDKPLKIKTSRVDPYTEIINSCYFTNTSRIYTAILVTFDKSGIITDAEIRGSSGCKALDEEYVKLVKKIKFDPEIKNGEPITVIKPMTFVIVIS
jgi:TonB family protein